MTIRSRIGRVLLFILAIGGSAASLSCNSGVGMGMGVSAPTRWGGGASSGPPVFVGGPGG